MPFSGRTRVMVLVVGVVVAVACSAVSASAKVVTVQSGHKIGYFPSPRFAKANPMACTTDCTLMTFHSGGVVQHTERQYLIFWAPSGHYLPASYRTGLGQWVSDFAGANFGPSTDFSVAQQYYDLTGPGSAKSFVPAELSNAGSFVDTNAYPASGCTDSDGGATLPVCLNDTQIRTEIQRVVTSQKWPLDQNTEYLLFTPKSVGSCFTSSSASCAYSQYCAYHSFATVTGGQIVYANMPWSYGTAGCDVNTAFGTGYANGSAIDPEVGVLSHEIIETMTDVHLNAWYDSAGNEIGDKCAYNYNGTTEGSMSGLANNGLGFYNQTAGTGQYLMQTEFSNRNSNGSSTGCVGKNTDVQPSVTVTITPNPPVHGSSAQFKTTVTDPAGVSTVEWHFGDGTTGTGSPVNHTYATAGTKTVFVIVTDGHGNQKAVTQTVTVS
jgi:hypothetical protein